MMAREDDEERRVNTVKEEKRDVGAGVEVVLSEVSRELFSAEGGGGVHQSKWIEGDSESTCCPLFNPSLYILPSSFES